MTLNFDRQKAETKDCQGLADGYYPIPAAGVTFTAAADSRLSTSVRERPSTMASTASIPNPIDARWRPQVHPMTAGHRPSHPAAITKRTSSRDAEATISAAGTGTNSSPSPAPTVDCLTARGALILPSTSAVRRHCRLKTNLCRTLTTSMQRTIRVFKTF